VNLNKILVLSLGLVAANFIELTAQQQFGLCYGGRTSKFKSSSVSIKRFMVPFTVLNGITHLMHDDEISFFCVYVYFLNEYLLITSEEINLSKW
jgi:hypothetical protein